MHFDIYYRKNLKGEPMAWIDNTRPRDLWINFLDFVTVFDWRKRLPPEPSIFDGTCFTPKRPRGKLAE